MVHFSAGDDDSRHEDEGRPSPDWREQRCRRHRHAGHRQQVVELPPDPARERNVVLEYQGSLSNVLV